MAKKITINMVAELAGVSRGTVDRVLNGRPHVSEENTEKVLSAMMELGYKPIHRPANVTRTDALGNKKRHYGVILPKRNYLFLEELGRGIEDARAQLSDFGVRITEHTTQTDNPQEVTEALDELASEGADGIVLGTFNHIDIVRKINALAESGIPVITYDTDLPDSRRLCFLGQNRERCGKVAAGLLNTYTEHGAGILTLIGMEALPEQKALLDAFKEQILAYGREADRLYVTETYDDYAITLRKVREILEQHSGIGGIYLVNHSLTGCVEAVKECGMAGRIRIVAQGMTPSIRHFLKSGDLDFAVTPNIYFQGYQPLILMHRYRQMGILPPAKESHSYTEIISREML